MISLQRKTINEPAFSPFNKFGIGEKYENKDMLLLISKDEGWCRLKIGPGLKKREYSDFILPACNQSTSLHADEIPG
ncbi:MAG TPA: TPM domain-containing protein [Actinobacteria bacterium]|nr:TPM domain-containing protein [Actinomycetota bacterium]